MGKPQFIDLFCGCGGFTLGMQRAGFACAAAIDFNTQAVATLSSNLSGIRNILHRDLTKFGPDELAKLLETDKIDVIVGGPPCQGFSTARQVDGANHGDRLKADARRFLYQEFLRYVDYYQPKVFVMENVLGLRTAGEGEYFTKVQSEARALGRARGHPGYRVHGQIEDASELGAPQKRRRQLIVGVRNDLPGYFLPRLVAAPRATPNTPLGVAIGDLPILRAGSGTDEREYDYSRRGMYLRKHGDAGLRYLFKVIEIGRADRLTNHVARPHNERDLRDFARLREGESSATAMRDRGVSFEFPYDKTSFKDRYTRQSRAGLCSTIVAHLGKDGLMFIHPTQLRSLTPREAARIQSFPDWFVFPKARTHAFRLIGNAVPPLVGEAVGLAVKKFMLDVENVSLKQVSRASNVPGPVLSRTDESITMKVDAARELEILARLDRRALRDVEVEQFLSGWHALLFLFPDLHPDNARNHGSEVELPQKNQLALPGFEELVARRYVRTGWPVALELIGLEAWRRYELNEIELADFYCLKAQRAGMAPLTRRVCTRLGRRLPASTQSRQL